MKTTKWLEQAAFFFPTSFGEFKLDVQPLNTEACPIPPKVFEVGRPVLELDIDINATPFCPFDPSSLISFETDFDEVDKIRWLIYDEDGNGTDLPQFDDLNEFTVDETGAYEVVLFNDLGCEIGRELILVEISENQALFDIPENLSICDSFELVPETELALIFTVKTPSGQVLSFETGESFLFEEQGIYEFEAVGVNEEDNLCRIIKSVEVTLSNSIAFSPELFEEDCDGKLIYWANILNANPDDFKFIWYDQNLDSIGQGQFFEPEFFGEFFLEVKPMGSLPCPDPFISFIIDEPVTSVDLVIIGGFICEDPGFTLLTLDTEEALIDKIVWFYLDPNGNKLELTQFENELAIAIEEEGVYEVEAMNHLGCILAQDEIVILKSVDDARPITDEEYVICLFYEVAERIDPGEFEIYEWVLEGELVHSERLFQPERPGQYTLTVTSIEGCQYSTEFTVVENCKFQVVYPNAVQPLNDDKNFMVYSNYLVDELSIWIYNKWGQLLFYCTDNDITERKASCRWDGTYDGEKLPAGSYVLKIQYKNRTDENYKNITDSIFIVD